MSLFTNSLMKSRPCGSQEAKKTLWACMLSVLLLGAWQVPLNAQVTEATILGTVTDSSGAAVANAMVEAKNTGTDLVRSAMSDAEGRYSVGNLPIGNYQVTVSLAGFQTNVRTGVTLTVG